mgnify:CR=1 FL=1
MIKGLISIVIPTYNGEKYIRDCLESIEKQEVNHEVIVVDDISSDKTVEIAKNMGAKIIINDIHKGQVASKNTGIKNMNGEYFVTIDQDDRLKPDALINLLTELNTCKSIPGISLKTNTLGLILSYSENTKCCLMTCQLSSFIIPASVNVRRVFVITFPFISEIEWCAHH